jgi:hypothetical protein
MKRSPPYEFGVGVKEDGVLRKEGDGDIRVFILPDLRMLTGVLVGVLKEGDADARRDEFRLEGCGGVFRRREDDSFFIIMVAIVK